jgi:NADP-dependent 3-hydroxy acid dehydrogenase YdfG
MTTKTILITGASTGFGRDSAETLARAGHRVIATMRDIEGRNRLHAQALRQQSIDVIELDVTDDTSVNSAVEALLASGRPIDVLINNAGIAAAGVTEAFTSDQATLLFNTNVVGVLRMTRAVLPAMRRQKQGLVINVGSILGRVTFPFFGIYGASKFAVEALSDSLRYELAPSGVDVALVQPSAYPTPMYANTLQPADTARVVEYGPVGEIPSAMFQHFTHMFQADDAPDPHDVAAAIAALVEMPIGTRPARTIVGAPFGSDVVNRDVAPVQSAVLKGLGLGQLDLATTA